MLYNFLHLRLNGVTGLLCVTHSDPWWKTLDQTQHKGRCTSRKHIGTTDVGDISKLEFNHDVSHSELQQYQITE